MFSVFGCNNFIPLVTRYVMSVMYILKRKRLTVIVGLKNCNYCTWIATFMPGFFYTNSTSMRKKLPVLSNLVCNINNKNVDLFVSYNKYKTYNQSITYGFYINHLGKTICETIQMPPQVRRAKVRDKQTPLSEIHIIPLHIFTWIGYVHRYTCSLCLCR